MSRTNSNIESDADNTMKQYKNHFVMCGLIYFILFLTVALVRYPVLSVTGRYLFFATLYNTNLWIPFLVNSLFFFYLCYKIVFGKSDQDSSK